MPNKDLLKGLIALDIGKALRALRLQRGLTQEELADRCELSKGFISQVERNLASPSIATLMDMLECLGSSLSDFFSKKSNRKGYQKPVGCFFASKLFYISESEKREAFR